jgi:hypothetical protein
VIERGEEEEVEEEEEEEEEDWPRSCVVEKRKFASSRPSGRVKLSETTNARFLSLFPFSLLLISPPPKERGAPVYVLIIGVMLRSTV